MAAGSFQYLLILIVVLVAALVLIVLVLLVLVLLVVLIAFLVLHGDTSKFILRLSAKIGYPKT